MHPLIKIIPHVFIDCVTNVRSVHTSILVSLFSFSQSNTECQMNDWFSLHLYNVPKMVITIAFPLMDFIYFFFFSRHQTKIRWEITRQENKTTTKMIETETKTQRNDNYQHNFNLFCIYYRFYSLSFFVSFSLLLISFFFSYFFFIICEVFFLFLYSDLNHKIV